MLICLAGYAALGSAATAAWAQPSATAALAQGSASASSVQGPVLALSVQAHEEVTEDTAHAMLAVERESRDAAEAQRQAAAVLRDALDAAKRERELTVTTDGFHTIPVYDKAGRISHYRAHAGLRIESRELATVARVAAQLSSIMQIRGSYFSLSRQKREAVETRLIEAAVREFNAKAAAAAAALGYARFELNRAALDQAGGAPVPMSMRAAAPSPSSAGARSAESAPPVAMEPGRTIVTVSMSGAVLLRN